MPDHTRVASYIKNQLSDKGTCVIVVRKKYVYISNLSIYGEGIPGLLVASERGASVRVGSSTPLNHLAFMSGGFDLQSSQTLASIFRALRGKRKVLGETSNG